MPDLTPDGQPPPERPEAVRKQQIDNLRDPELREKLQAQAKERDAAVMANSKRHDEASRADVITGTKQRVDKAYGFAPDAPKEYQAKQGHQRATDDARASGADNKVKTNEAVAYSFNKQIDPHLDEHYGPYDPKSKYEQFQKLNRETVPAKEGEAPAKVPPAQAARSNDPVLVRPVPPPEVSPNQPQRQSSQPPAFDPKYAREDMTVGKTAQMAPQPQQQTRPPAVNPQHARQETGPAVTAQPAPSPSPSPKQAPAVDQKRDQVKEQEKQQGRGREL